MTDEERIRLGTEIIAGRIDPGPISRLAVDSQYPSSGKGDGEESARQDTPDNPHYRDRCGMVITFAGDLADVCGQEAPWLAVPSRFRRRSHWYHGPVCSVHAAIYVMHGGKIAPALPEPATTDAL